MNTTIEEIGKLLSDPAFYEANKDLERPEDIIEAIKERVPSATNEEIDAFLNKVSESAQKGDGELTEEALEDVAGGIIVTAAVIGAVVKCVTLAIAVGGLTGSAIWYWKNRKK